MYENFSKYSPNFIIWFVQMGNKLNPITNKQIDFLLNVIEVFIHLSNLKISLINQTYLKIFVCL